MKKIMSAASSIPRGIELRKPTRLTGEASPSTSSPIITPSVKYVLAIPHMFPELQ